MCRIAADVRLGGADTEENTGINRAGDDTRPRIILVIIGRNIVGIADIKPVGEGQCHVGCGVSCKV